MTGHLTTLFALRVVVQNFASRSDRFRASSAPPAALDMADYDPESGAAPRGDPARLGPGCYNPPDQWSKKTIKYKNAAFGSESKRATVVQAGNTPGPGRYNNDIDVKQVFRPYTVPAKDIGFGVAQNRFKGPGSYTPGPGYYSTNGEMVRKSFNITYAGVQA